MISIIKKTNWHDNIIWILIAATLILFSSDFIGAFIIPEINREQAYLYTFVSYMEFLTLWVGVILSIKIFKKNNYIKDSLTTKTKRNTIYFLFLGFVVGFILNAFCALIAFYHGDFELEFVKFDILPVLGLFIAVFVQSSSEEVLCRGFIYQRLIKAKFNPFFVAIINSLFFAILHLQNNGMNMLSFYDLFITGVFFSFVVYYFDSLWMAMGIHTTWNFTQSILLGLPNSGTSFPYSIFKISGNTQGSFAYDVAFGLEGTIFASLLMTFGCVVLYLWKNKEKNIFKITMESDIRKS
ncbi:TPA: CPBP family intramembrane metalloprotease [Streptococcus agalactiae]|nr:MULTISPECIES: type II CAAX endopeptidase family protein [Terrabacteria group]CCW41813.1 protease, putative [Streptococcus agalactiae ILRI112]APG82125.1 CAAX amino terminal protease family protein [Corynebacterium pseudotuberculosis]ASA48278.1 CPBP family intramembrane metalloprotease [Corynebacterium pseudotuberculosis Cp162]OTG44241.1 CPBP family intramembrane metalloprotease [Streptococcus agalactiae]OTG46697.1 CPBP family intramembrane metalloprotease [Streptococcus agalactiae]